MFGKKKEITITLKLFAGLEKGLNIKITDPRMGAQMKVNDGSRLKELLKSLGMKDLSSNAYYCNGKRIGLWTKLRDGDEITCLRPSGGG